MTIDKETLKAALNDSALAKSKDINSLISALGGKVGSSSASDKASEKSAEASNDATESLKKFADSIVVGAGAFVDSFTAIGGKVMDVNLRLSDITDTAGTFSKTMLGQVLGLESLSKATGVAAGALSGIIQYAEKNVDVWRRLSDVGASFGNDAIAMDVAAKNMRLSTDDMSDIVRKNTADLAKMGGTVEGGAKVFTEFSRVFHESGANEQLLQMGMNEKEINELLVLQATSTRSMMRMAKTPAQLEAEVNAAKAMAEEMDAMARLTGKSRQEQMDMQRALKNDAQVQAAINQAIAKGGKDVEVSFGRAVAATAGLGPEMQGLFKGVLASGQLSANATREQQQMYSLIGAEARSLLKQASDAAKAGKADEAERLTAAASVAASRSDGAKQAEKMSMMGVESMMLMQSNTMKQRQTMQVQEENAKAAGKSSLSSRELAEFALEEAKKENKARSGATAIIVAAENEGTKLSAAMANNLIEPINKKIGPGLLNFYDTVLKPRAKGSPGITDYQISNTPPPMIRSDEGDELRRRERERRGIEVPPHLDDTKNQKPGGDSFLSKLGLGTLSLADGVINISKEAKITMLSREKGSLGMTGKLMEDFGSGTLAMLHGKESVVTEDQMKNLMANIQAGTNQNMPQILQQALGTLKTAMPAATTQNTESVEQDFKSVAATLSSDASLNDLLGALNQLNTKMSQLIDTHADVGSKQIRATKSNNANLYAR